MSNDTTTLADVQPGGRVRLGDARALIQRYDAAGAKFRESLMDDRYSDAQRVELRRELTAVQDELLTALSAQPSQGGQEDAVHCGKCKGRGYVHVDVDVDDSGGSIGNIEACPHCAIAAPPSPGGQDALDCIGRIEEAIEFRVPHDIYAAVHGDLAELKAALDARQPVGELRLPPDGFYKIVYDDAEVLDESFARSGALDAALRRFEQISNKWNAHLFVRFANNTRDCTVPNATPAQAVDLGQTFQAGVSEWMGQCFLPSLYSNMTERGDRLLEEVLELLQAHGYDKARVPTLVDYVFGRPVGEPAQEVGGVMVTLAGYCWVAGLDMHAAGDAELARINQPDVMAKIRAKQEAKNALHFDTPLPGDPAATIATKESSHG